jgi:hypothetical protein
MGVETFVRGPRAANEDVVIDSSLRGPGSFSVSTQLMQDAVPAVGVSVGSGPYNQEALFANPFKDGREEALVINAQDQLTYLQRSEASDTGWVQEPVPGVSGALSEVVTAVHPNRSVWAFCVPAPGAGGVVGPLQALVLSGGDGRSSWSAVPDFIANPCTSRSLCVSYTSDAGPVVVGGMALPTLSMGTIALSAQAQGSNTNVAAPWGVVSGPSLNAGRVVGGGYVPVHPLHVADAPNGLYVWYVLNGTNLTRYQTLAHDGQLASLPVSS